MNHFSRMIFVAASIVLTSACSVTPGREADNVKIFYLPFSYSTFAPTTMLTIREEASCAFVMPRKAFDKLIRKFITTQPAKAFDERVVRLEAQYQKGNSLFVDQEGVLSPIDTYSGMAIGKGELADFDQQLASEARRHGCTGL